MVLQGSTAAVTGGYWFQYTPAQMLGVVRKYGGAPSIPARSAEAALGKWVFYFKGGNYQNNPDGRRAAARVIARDLQAQGFGTFTQDQIWQILQYVNAFLLKDEKLPGADRGPQSFLQARLEAERKHLRELAARAAEAAKATKEGIDPRNIFSPGNIWGGVGVVALVGVAGFLAYKVLTD